MRCTSLLTNCRVLAAGIIPIRLGNTGVRHLFFSLTMVWIPEPSENRHGATNRFSGDTSREIDSRPLVRPMEQCRWGWIFYRRVQTGKTFYRPMNRFAVLRRPRPRQACRASGRDYRSPSRDGLDFFTRDNSVSGERSLSQSGLETRPNYRHFACNQLRVGSKNQPNSN
jgi:hypothetical protein